MIPDPNWFLETISGKRTGIAAELTRSLLFPASLVYRFVIGIRNWAYNCGFKKIHHVGVPVISIGNLTTGGTGKTPLVIWLANRLKNDHNVTILSRGYGARQGELNDEGQEIEAACPGVKQIQNPDRVGAAQILKQQGPSAIILDDGFQHRKMHRDLDIVLIDATNPFGFGAMLPRGLLREPIASIQRSDLVLLTRSNLVSPDVRRRIRHEIEKHHDQLMWAEAELRTIGWIDLDHGEHDLDYLHGRRLFVFCAIGNPNGFIQTLRQQQFEIVGERKFDDHHHFSLDDLEEVERDAQAANSDALVCTMKDLVKLRSLQIPGTPIYALKTGFEIVGGAGAVDRILDQVLPKLKDSRRNEFPEPLSHR